MSDDYRLQVRRTGRWTWMVDVERPAVMDVLAPSLTRLRDPTRLWASAWTRRGALRKARRLVARDRRLRQWADEAEQVEL